MAGDGGQFVVQARARQAGRLARNAWLALGRLRGQGQWPVAPRPGGGSAGQMGRPSGRAGWQQATTAAIWARASGMGGKAAGHLRRAEAMHVDGRVVSLGRAAGGTADRGSSGRWRPAGTRVAVSGRVRQ